MAQSLRRLTDWERSRIGAPIAILRKVDSQADDETPPATGDPRREEHVPGPVPADPTEPATGASSAGDDAAAADTSEPGDRERAPAPAADVMEPGRVALRWLRARPEAVWLVLLAGIVRAAAAWTNPALLRDSVSLLEAAALARENGPGALIGLAHHPLPPYLISLAPDGLSLEAFAVILGVLAGALAVYPLHALVRHVSGRHAATAAGVLYATLPEAVAVGAVPLSEGVYVPLAILALSLVLSARVPCHRVEWAARLVLAGLAGGLAYLCRPEGLVVALGAIVLAVTVRRRGRRLLGAALVVIGIAIPAAPYVSALSADKGRIVLSPKKDVARFAGTRPIAPPTGDSLTTGEVAPTRDAAEARQRPQAENLATAVRGTVSGLERALTLPGILLLAFGALGYRRWKRRRLRWPRTVVIGTAAVLSALVVRLHMGWGYGGGRHMLTVALLLVGFAGEGIYLLGAFVPRITTRRRLTIVIALLIALPTGVRSVLRPPGEGGMDARELGRRLAALHAEHEGSADVATFGEPRVAYYLREGAPETGARDIRLVGRHAAVLKRGGELPDARAALVETLRSDGATYLVLDAFDRGDGTVDGPARALLRRLIEDGAVELPTAASAGRLVAVRIRRD